MQKRREQEVAFLVAKLAVEKYFRDEEHNVEPWLFPDLLAITRRWLAECVTLKDDTFKQLLLSPKTPTTRPTVSIKRSWRPILAKSGLPIPKPYDKLGSTRHVSFDTIRPTYRTDPAKCHVSHVAGDTESWEQKMAESLEGMDGVRAYVKNQGLGFTIPYTLSGQQHAYVPDFIVRIDDGSGDEDLLNLILEISGKRDKDKEAKVATARTLWVPAVNNAGTWGRWAFIEIGDPWDAKNSIRSTLATEAAGKW